MQFRNYLHGSPLAISVLESPAKDTYSEASLRRMNLNGHISRVKGQEKLDEVEKCYLQAHPDSIEWIPSHKGAPHSGSWWQFKVESVYYFGGEFIII